MGFRREKKVSRPQIHHIHRVLESPATTTSLKVKRGRWSETTHMMRRHYRQDTVVEESPARR
jgi:hypothetical protein